MFRPRGWETDDGSVILGTGSISTVLGSEDGRPAMAILWIPDPEQRRGWRTMGIWPASAPANEPRPIGFRRP